MDDAAAPSLQDTRGVAEGDVNLSATRAAWLARFADRAQSGVGGARRDGSSVDGVKSADERVFVHQSLSTPCLDVIERAEGCELIAADGRRYLDFHGNSAHPIGYGHPAVLAAAERAMRRLSFCPRRYTNAEAVRLAERLAGEYERATGWPGKVLLAPGGAEAVEMALKLGRLATGRDGVVGFEGAFHGATLGAISVGGQGFFKAGMGRLLPGCVSVPGPAAAGCGLCAGRTAEPRCSGACAGKVAAALSREVGVFIGEAVRCTTVDLPGEGYWEAVRMACDASGALLVLDEIPLALGRTGRWFSFERWGVRPDMVVLGKGLGGGLWPMAALVCRADLDVAGHLALGHFTHEKSPVGCAVASATLDVIEAEALVERSERLGDTWREALGAWVGRRGVLAVRGVGLLVAVQLETAARADAVMYGCLRRGLSFKVSGGTVLTLTPPLVIGEAELARAMAMLNEALDEAWQKADR